MSNQIWPKSNQKKLDVMATFLSHAYGLCSNPNSISRIVQAVEWHWDDVMTFAQKNRVRTNIVAVIAESPKLNANLSKERRKTIAVEYLSQQAQATRDKQQLIEIDSTNVQSDCNFILMKGGTRLFDDIYPSMFHRYTTDLDIFFTIPTEVVKLERHGYETEMESASRITDLTNEYLIEYSKKNHHFPPLFSNNFKKRVEIHFAFIDKTVSVSMRNQAIAESTRITETVNLYKLERIDQLILLIIHSQLCDKHSRYSTTRLRSVIESVLLYRALSKTERGKVHNHFEQQNLQTIFNFWIYSCHRILSCNDNPIRSTLFLRFRFFLHRATTQEPVYIRFRYLFYYLKKLFVLRSIKLEVVSRKALNPSNWASFIQRLKSIK